MIKTEVLKYFYDEETQMDFPVVRIKADKPFGRIKMLDMTFALDYPRELPWDSKKIARFIAQELLAL